MGRPNYQRILQAHGKLPDQLMADLGIKVIEAEVTGQKIVVTTEEMTPKKGEKVVLGKYDEVVDASGKKLVDYAWSELKSKAVADGIFKKEMKKVDIMDAYLAKFNALPSA